MSRWTAAATALSGLGWLASCLEPTSLGVEVYSDVDCASRPEVIVVGGSALSELATRAPSATSSRCESTGRVGRFVVLPSDGDVVAFAVVTRLGGDRAEECVAGAPPRGCVVARRQLRFIEHKSLEMRVDLRSSCANIVCPPDQTCVVGVCVPAGIGECAGVCSESDLLPPGVMPGGPPVWRPVAPLPTPRSAMAVALGGDGRIYVAGGRVDAGNTAVNEAFDPVTGGWSTASPLPSPNEYMAAATGRDGRVYVFGGVSASMRSTLAFDVGAQAWTARPDMPTGRIAPSAATAPDGSVYVIGGDNLLSNAELRTVEAFDPATSTWRARASMPTGRSALAVSSSTEGRIYAFGGNNVTTPGSGRNFDDNETYDPATDTWKAAARMPAPASPYSALGPDGRIYVSSGSAVRAYAPARDAWEDVAPPRSEHGGGPVVQGPDGRIYVIGGTTAAGYTGAVEAYGPVLEVSPTSGRPGASLHVGGSNFAPYARVSITLDDVSGPALAVSKTDAYGALAPPITLDVPAGVAPGLHALVVIDDRSRFPVRRAVTVE